MTSTMVYNVTVCFARRQEYLNAITHHKVSSIERALAPNFPSRMGWEDLLEVGLMIYNSIRSLKKKWKKDLKYLKKQNKMIYSIYNKSGLRLEIKNIKNIRAKASNNTSVYSGDDWDSNSSIASGIS